MANTDMDRTRVLIGRLQHIPVGILARALSQEDFAKVLPGFYRLDHVLTEAEITDIDASLRLHDLVRYSLGDAAPYETMPSCGTCGIEMIRDGKVYRCLNCGDRKPIP